MSYGVCLFIYKFVRCGSRWGDFDRFCFVDSFEVRLGREEIVFYFVLNLFEFNDMYVICISFFKVKSNFFRLVG